MQETQETWVQSLGGEDPLEEEMATHCSILAWKIPWTEGPGGLQSMGLWRARHKWALTAHSTRVTKIRICFRGDLFLGKCFPLMFWTSLVTQTSRKESACNAGDLGLIPGLGRSPGEGNGNLLQYSCLENSMDRGAWWAIVHGVKESNTTEWLTLSILPFLGVLHLPW